mgnify:CR=1 FL=1
MLNGFENLYQNNFALDNKDNPFLLKKDKNKNEKNSNEKIKQKTKSKNFELYKKDKIRYLPYQRIKDYLSENLQFAENEKENPENSIATKQNKRFLTFMPNKGFLTVLEIL